MKCKPSYLLHPIFDAFLGLKWKRVSLPFYFHLSWTFAYTFIIMCYSLKRFSILKEVVIPCVFGDLNIIEFGMTVLFPESIIEDLWVCDVNSRDSRICSELPTNLCPAL